MSAHVFLSPEWIAAVRLIRAEYAHHEGEIEFVVAANVTVTGPPFGDESIAGHIDATGPTLMIEPGHLDEPEFSIEVPYDVAHRLFVQRDPAAVMPALLGGQVKLTGDSSKLLLLAGSIAPPPEQDERRQLAREVLRRVIEVTA